jgi:hypothetical protein
MSGILITQFIDEKKGHKVTMVTTFPDDSYRENYEEIQIDHPQDWSERISRSLAHPKRSAVERQTKDI